MFVVDTNVLVGAVDESAPGHDRCRDLVETWRRQAGAWYSTWGILYEFLRVTTHFRVLRRPLTLDQSLGVLEDLFLAPSFSLLIETDRHLAVARELTAQVPLLAGSVIHDVHTAVLMKEHGIRRIYTRDTHFHRFPFLEAVDPLSPLEAP